MSPAADLAASQSPEVLRQSALQYHETFLIRWVCSFEENFTEQETLHSLTEILQSKLIQMWKMLAELLQACSPDAQGTHIQKMKKEKKKSFIYTDYCV